MPEDAGLYVGQSGPFALATMADLPGVVGVRDSKDPTGPALVFGPVTWRGFVEYAKRQG